MIGNDMRFTVEKIRLRLPELALWRYRYATPCDDMFFQQAEGTDRRPPVDALWSRIRPGHAWEGRDRTAWLRIRVNIPSSWEGRDVVGVFDFGTTSRVHTSGFESLLLIDGEPYQGVDQNHKEVFLPATLAGRPSDLLFHLWSGLEGGGHPVVQRHRIGEPFLACLDRPSDDLYFWLKIAIETIEILPEDNPARVDLLALVDKSFLQVDWTDPGSDIFYASVAEADRTFTDGLRGLDKGSTISVNCIGHSHIDVAWLWRLSHTREKSMRTFATALRLMERYPEYIFLQTQPQLYAYMKEDSDALYRQIRRRVAEGRWEADGAMWLEADCNLISGESLVRQMLLGTRFFREEFGTACTCLWLPDVFGFSAALPQIMKGFSLGTFMTTKISWNMYNRFPWDTFSWKGLDGSEVLAHMITTPSPNSYFHTYNANTDPASLLGVWKEYRQKRLNRDLIVCYGHGDGGGGPTREMIERIRRSDRMPGLPRVRSERAGDYFRRLHETVSATDQFVPTWDGELYLEIHRGTYTSQAYNKKTNRKLEILLRETEWLSVIRSLLAGDWRLYERDRLQECWRTVLRNQFHDIIPGSSIHEVYQDSRNEYGKAAADLDAVARSAVGFLRDGVGGEMTVFNSSPLPRDGDVQVPGTAMAWTDEKGNPLPSQPTGEGSIVRVRGVPPMGCATIRPSVSAMGSAETPFRLEGRRLRTPHYEVEWDEAGRFALLLDRDHGRKVLAEGCAGNVLQIFDDRPLHGKDGWGLEIYYMEKHDEVSDLIGFELRESGPLRCAVVLSWRYGRSSIRQEIRFHAHSRRIDFVTEVDWQETRKLLKAAFPVDVRATEATYDIQFGNVKRPTHWNTSWDYARFEVCAHQWADLSQRDYGVSLLNDCKYGHDIHENVMRITLLKSPIFPDVSGDKGLQAFTYAILPHAGDWVAAGTAECAWDLNAPLRAVAGTGPRGGFSLFSVDRPGVMIDAVKKAEDSDRVVLRLHEYTGASTDVCVLSGLRILSWQECALDEAPIGASRPEKEIRFRLKPFEIKTFLLDIAV
jgi:alpha-mannosidase